MVVYGAQECGNHPETSHCFATFARMGAGGRVELQHINWFSIRGHQTGWTYALFEPDGQPTRPEPGENRPTREALLLARQGGLRIARWGPYEIERGLFERATRQIDLLEGRIPGRRVLYKALDLGYRSDASMIRAMNCVHAISDIDREPALLRTWTSYGDEAARKIVRHLGRWVKHGGAEQPSAWGPIWEETWRGVPVPEPLEVRCEASPWPPAGPFVQAGPEPGAELKAESESGPKTRAGADERATAAPGGGD
jgi:hypothetical protein